MRIHIDQEKVKDYMIGLKDMMQKEDIKAPVDINKSVPEMLQALAMRPDIAKAMMPLQRTLYFNGRIERALKEKIFVRVSQLNKCQFCTATHTKALETLSLEEEGKDEREKVAIEYSEQVTRNANEVSDELFERLKKHFDEGEIIELTLSIGMINLFNKFNDSPQIRFRE
ncbi:MAG: carboxymuconolactone decarboxylase family protein [Candidatus Scalindua sp.]